jgi:serine/threonine protein kinase
MTQTFKEVERDSMVGPSEMTEGKRTKRLGLGPPKRVTIDETVTHKDDHAQYPMTPITGPESGRKESRHDLTTQTNSVTSTTEEDNKSSRSIKVNGKQYKVLQVIGKGGSSKVFRVMDANGELFALKKVNLKNLDEFTLQGYINEIELLETFAGDEHIIKLIDSELNHGRSCLYVVLNTPIFDHSQFIDHGVWRDRFEHAIEAVPKFITNNRHKHQHHHQPLLPSLHLSPNAPCCSNSALPQNSALRLEACQFPPRPWQTKADRFWHLQDDPK